MSPLTVEIRENGKRIAQYPTGKLGKAQELWLQETGAQFVSADTLCVPCGLLTMAVKQDGANRRIEVIVVVN